MARDGKYGGNTEGRDAKGHFSSGNPGKPLGARHKATLAEAEGLARKVVEMALAGDVTALRLCLERLVPPSRAALAEHPALLTVLSDMPGQVDALPLGTARVQVREGAKSGPVAGGIVITEAEIEAARKGRTVVRQGAFTGEHEVKA